MNVILITILLTVLGVCVVALLTWLCVSSYKLMKFRKKAEGSFKHLERWIDDNNNMIQKRVDDVIGETNRVSEENMNSISKEIDEIDRKIDSRCDKLSDKFEKDIDTYYKLSIETQKRVETLMEVEKDRILKGLIKE
jgi:hypothetical protein